MTLLFAGLIFLPGVIQMDGMHGGYALSFVAFFGAVSAAVISMFFWRRARALDRLLSGETVLAHWTYSPDVWQRYTDDEVQKRTKDKAGLFLIAAVWALFFGLLFWFLDREAGWVVFLVMLGLTLLLGGLAYGLPRLWRMRRRRGPGEAWIAPGAIYFDGSFFRWTHDGSRLEKVDLLERQENVSARLRFRLRVLSRTGEQAHDLRIPVPRGREAEARVLLDHFTGGP